MRRGSQDETRLPADRQEVTEGTAVKQTTIPGEDRKQTDSSKHNDIQTQIPFKERYNTTPQRTASNQDLTMVEEGTPRLKRGSEK